MCLLLEVNYSPPPLEMCQHLLMWLRVVTMDLDDVFGICMVVFECYPYLLFCFCWTPSAIYQYNTTVLYLIFTFNILTCLLPATLLKRNIYLYPLLSSPSPPVSYRLGFSQTMFRERRLKIISFLFLFNLPMYYFTLLCVLFFWGRLSRWVHYTLRQSLQAREFSLVSKWSQKFKRDFLAL